MNSPMNIKRLLAAVTLCVCVITAGFGCLPDEGGNPSDPLSPNYVPTWPLVYAYPLGSTEVMVSWTDRSLGETGFQIVRSEQLTSGYVLIATVGTNETSYEDIDTTFIRGKKYYYKVRAFTPAHYGSYSNESIVTIP